MKIVSFKKKPLLIFGLVCFLAGVLLTIYGPVLLSLLRKGFINMLIIRKFFNVSKNMKNNIVCFDRETLCFVIEALF